MDNKIVKIEEYSEKTGETRAHFIDLDAFAHAGGGGYPLLYQQAALRVLRDGLNAHRSGTHNGVPKAQEYFAKEGFPIFSDEPSFGLLSRASCQRFVTEDPGTDCPLVRVCVDFEKDPDLAEAHKAFGEDGPTESPLEPIAEDLEKMLAGEKNSLPDKMIKQQGTFTVSKGGPVCPVCRTFEITDFSGEEVPYRFTGLDIADFPKEDVDDHPLDECYPVEFFATGTCPCSEYVSYSITADFDYNLKKPELSFEVVERDRLSRTTKDLGALGWMPNYRN